MRKTEFANNEYYHIYNRGVDKREVFSDRKDYLRFLESMREFNNIKPIGSLYELNYRRIKKEETKETKFPIGNLVSRLTNIICYCLNLNHYHLLIKQLSEKGISKFMHKLDLGYLAISTKNTNAPVLFFKARFKPSILIPMNIFFGFPDM